MNLNYILDGIESSFVSAKNSIRETKEEFKKSEVYVGYVDWRNSMNANFCVPLASAYRKLPYQLTDWKFDIIHGYTYGERLMLVNSLSLITAIFAFRNFKAANMVGVSLRAVKNTGLMYLAAGLVVAPEIYNPIMKTASTFT